MGPPTDKVSLVLYGTGIRGAEGNAPVRVTVGGVNAPVVFSGADGRVPGLDRVVATLPRTLADRRGELEVKVRVDEPSAGRVLESNVGNIRITAGEADPVDPGDPGCDRALGQARTLRRPDC